METVHAETAQSNSLKSPMAFQLRTGSFALTILDLYTAEVDAIRSQLALLVQSTPKFFDQTSLVIDLFRLSTLPCFKTLLELLRHFKMIPVAVRGGTPIIQAEAIRSGLAVFPEKQSRSPAATPRKKLAASANSVVQSSEQSSDSMASVVSGSKSTTPLIPSQQSKPIASKVIRTPVRSGQQIYAKNTDLIVIADVSHGAELIADGHIHVYGELHGRALAGVQGNQDVQIFCQLLDAELIAIAGHYKVKEDLVPPVHENNNFVTIFLEHEQLRIEKL